MIPKKIHYCWFGGNPLPKVAQKCIASWRKYCPDYEIIEWNERNFDINRNEYMKMCYAQKKYAFLTDYVRLLVVQEQGGLYFDTDVELLKSFDDLLDCGAFFGFETAEYIASGLGFGAEAHHPLLEKMLHQYDRLLDGQHGIIGCPILNTDAMKQLGFMRNGQNQRIGDVCVYACDYFNPLNNATGEVKITANTHSIHWYSMLWLSKRKRIRSKVTRVFHRIFGVDCFQWLKREIKTRNTER